MGWRYPLKEGGAALTATLLALALGGVFPGAASATSGVAKLDPTGAVTRYAVGPARGLDLGAIGAGGDGNMWVVAARGDDYSPKSRLLRVTPGGAVTQFSAGITPDVHIAGLTAGPDGNVWFTEGHASRVAPEPAGIGRITPSGEITEFSTGSYFYNPRGIAAGPDGHLWMTDWGGGNIVRVSTSGKLTDSFHLGQDRSPWGIVSGPDGNLWFTDHGRDRVARITPTGGVTEFSAGISADSLPTEIAAGPDGTLWFVQALRASVGRVTTSGSVDQIAVPMMLKDIAPGPDGTLYVTGTRTYGKFAIGGLLRITPAGGVTQIPVGPCSYPGDIAAGPAGSVWFTDSNASGCPPIRVDIAKRFTIDKRGVARIQVLCGGGDPTVPCEGIVVKLAAAVRYRARGPRGKRVLRKKTVALGSTRFSIGGPPNSTSGRVGVAKVKLTRVGRRLLGKSRSGSVRVRAQVTLGSATTRRELILGGPQRRERTRNQP